MSFYQSYLKLCNSIGKSPTAVATSIGISRTSVNRWKNGSTPTDANILAIAEYFCVSPAYFEDKNEQPEIVGVLDSKYNQLDEHGKALVDMILEAEYTRCTAPKSSDKVVQLSTIRHYLSRPAAGVGGLVEGEDYEDIELPEDAPKGADYCLTVSGDSMEPVIHDGQMVYVKRDVPLEPQDIGVFIVDGAAYVKQFFPGIAGQTYLVSANPKRQDANITLLADSDSTVFYAGKVLI